MAAVGTDAGGTWNTTAGNKTVVATPAAGDLIVVIHGISGWASGDDSTITDNNSDGNGTYHKIGTASSPVSTGGGTACALWISVRNSPIGSASSTTFTATNTGDTGGGLTVLRFSGMNRFGSLAVKQSIGESTATESPPTITFGATTLTGNPVVLAVMGEDNPAAVTPPTGFTEADDTGWATPTTGVEVCWDDSGNTATLFSWSGGALTDHNEVGIELDASGPSLTPGLGALTITGFAPTPQLTPAGGFHSWPALWPYGFGVSTSGTNITPGLGQLAITGYAPTTSLTITSGLGALTISGQVPTIDLGITPGLGQLTFTGLVPSVSATENVFISSGLGDLVLTGFAPAVSATANGSINTGLGELTIAGQIPTVGATDNHFVSPGLGELVITGLSPQVGANPNITPDVGLLVLTGFAPTASTTTSKGFQSWPLLWPYGFGTATGYIFPDVGQLFITGYAPNVVAPLQIIPGLGQLTITGFNPSLNVAGNTNVSPGLGQLVITGYVPEQTLTLPSPAPATLVLTGYAPTLSIGGPLSISSGLGQLVLTGFAPTVSFGNQAVSAGLGQLTITGFAPIVSTTEDQDISSGLGQLVLTGFAPSVSDNKTVFPGLGELTITGLQPTISATDHKWADAAVANLLITCFAPTITQAGSFSVVPDVGNLYINSLPPSIESSEQGNSGGWPIPRRRRRKHIAPQQDEPIDIPVVQERLTENRVKRLEKLRNDRLTQEIRYELAVQDSLKKSIKLKLKEIQEEEEELMFILALL